jgi:hypothetical protein
LLFDSSTGKATQKFTPIWFKENLPKFFKTHSMFLQEIPQNSHCSFGFLASNKPNVKTNIKKPKLEKKKTYLEGTHMFQFVSFSPSLSLGESLPPSVSSHFCLCFGWRGRKESKGKKEGKEGRGMRVLLFLLECYLLSFFLFFFALRDKGFSFIL